MYECLADILCSLDQATLWLIVMGVSWWNLLENTISRNPDRMEWGEVMEGEWCILCREVSPTAVSAQWGQSPVPECQWERMSLSQTNTSVSRPQSPHQSDHLAWCSSVIIHHCLLGKGQEGQPDKDADPVTAISINTGMCWKNRESERDREKSEREGEVKTDLSGKGRREGGRTPSFFLWKIRGCVWAHLDGLEELTGLRIRPT